MTYRYPGGLVRKTAANTSITGASGVWDLGSQAQAVKTNTWPISGLANPVSGSLRFRNTITGSPSSPAYLNRTFAAGNQQRWTFSAWVKKTLGRQTVFGRGSTQFGSMQFESDDTLSLNWAVGGTTYFATTTQVFRDPSAWYHLVWAIDTTQATSTNRQRLYVNGVEVTAWSNYTTIPQNSNGNINTANSHWIGRFWESSFEFPFSGYMAEVNFIDGQQLTSSSFGQTSPITGVWEPIKYTGTYGTNGFYLSLSDTSSIGKDFSGNGNNWTPNNISTASGSTFDLMRDVPTQWAPQDVTDVGGTVRGNYCTWNPLNKSTNHNSTNGNLTASSSGGTSYGAICATMGVTSGKWYWEMTYTRNGSTNSPVIGFGNDLFKYTTPPDGYLGSDLNAGGINVFNGNAAINATSTSYGSAIATNDVVMFAMDLDNRKFYIGKNGTWFNSGNPVAGTNQWPYSATIVGSTFFPAVNMFNDTGDTNFGQRPFTYTPPSGFKSLCTTNLPTPTIGATAANAANKYFDNILYTGNGATIPSSQSITGLQFQPDFTWIKSRSDAYPNFIFDAVRGAGRELVTNTTAAETNKNQLSTFNSNGFSVAVASDGSLGTNGNGSTFVAWNWNAGGSTVTNTTGSISAQVRANPTAGFSVATFTGNGTAGATVGHGLGVAPSMIMFKERSTGTSGLVWHTGYGTNQGQQLIDSTAAIYNPGNGLYFNSTYPSSTVVTLGTSGATNGSGSTYVLYSWAAVAGFSAFGSYTGNGSTDGPFVYTGFRPRFILVKSTGASNWFLWDTARNAFNATTTPLFPNISSAEEGTLYPIDVLSNGFKLRGASGLGINESATYIYMAFAEHPFKNALAR